MIYICALPLIFSLIVLAKTYSLVMSTVIVVFKTAIVFFDSFRVLALTCLSLSKKLEGLSALWLVFKLKMA